MSEVRFPTREQAIARKKFQDLIDSGRVYGSERKPKPVKIKLVHGSWHAFPSRNVIIDSEKLIVATRWCHFRNIKEGRYIHPREHLFYGTKE